MFGLISVASLALSAVTAVNGIVLPHGSAAARHAHIARDASTYDSAALEPYAEYNTRYWAIGCPSQHNTQFFDECCHPLLKGETVERNRDAKCNPANLSSTASSAAPTATDDGEECDDGDETSSAAPTTHSPTSSAAPAATSSAAPVNVGAEPPKESATTEVTTHTPTATPTTHTPTTSHTPTPTATATPTPAAASGSSNFAGVGTWFTQNGVAGACGTVHSDNDFIVALDYRKYGDTSARSPYCGKSLTITNTKTGNTQTATVADACPTCGESTDLDLSVALFKALSNNDLGLGVLDIKWDFN